MDLEAVTLAPSEPVGGAIIHDHEDPSNAGARLREHRARLLGAAAGVDDIVDEYDRSVRQVTLDVATETRPLALLADDSDRDGLAHAGADQRQRRQQRDRGSLHAGESKSIFVGEPLVERRRNGFERLRLHKQAAQVDKPVLVFAARRDDALGLGGRNAMVANAIGKPSLAAPRRRAMVDLQSTIASRHPRSPDLEKLSYQGAARQGSQSPGGLHRRPCLEDSSGSRVGALAGSSRHA